MTLAGIVRLASARQLLNMLFGKLVALFGMTNSVNASLVPTPELIVVTPFGSTIRLMLYRLESDPLVVKLLGNEYAKTAYFEAKLAPVLVVPLGNARNFNPLHEPKTPVAVNFVMLVGMLTLSSLTQLWKE